MNIKNINSREIINEYETKENKKKKIVFFSLLASS